jgi:hypothetical protein
MARLVATVTLDGAGNHQVAMTGTSSNTADAVIDVNVATITLTTLDGVYQRVRAALRQQGVR